MSGSATDLGQESGPMQHAIEKQAKHLGMDLETDQEFLWLAKESLNAELPAGWISRTFGKDQHYYVNRKTGDISYGKIPPYSVIVPGSLPDKKNPSAPSLSCAVIIKQVDEKTRSKTSINDLLRE